MTPEQLSASLLDAVSALAAQGSIAVTDGLPQGVTLARPRHHEYVDYASNLAFQLATPAGLDACELAGLLAQSLGNSAGIDKVQVAGAGFLNITVEPAARGQVARDIVARGSTYPRRTEDGETVQLAHARASGFVRNADRLGVPLQGDTSLLTHQREVTLLRELADPTASLSEIAEAFVDFTEACPVLPVGDQPPTAINSARRVLVDATRIALADGLNHSNLSAPERM